MFEFELKGGIDELRKVEMELLDYLGFGKKLEMDYPCEDYDNICQK